MYICNLFLKLITNFRIEHKTNLMRNFFTLLMLTFFSVGYAQHTGNRFEEEDARINREQQNTAEPFKDELQKGPGNPGGPVPIDVYIPILIFTAVGIILYRTMKKNAI